MSTISDPINLAIIREVYKAAEKLGADAGLLACIGSWGDTLDDGEVLSMIKAWNEMGEPFIPRCHVAQMIPTMICRPSGARPTAARR